MGSSQDIESCGRAVAKAFLEQTKLYSELQSLSRTISGKLSVTKGDFSSILPAMKKKQALLTQIDSIKAAITNDISFWQENRDKASVTMVNDVFSVLDEVELEIKKFLNLEKMLQKQIQFYSGDKKA